MSYYFAYGSNLDQEDRERWCLDHKIEDFIESAIEPVYLPDHELVFHYRSSSRGGGALDVKGRRGQLVAGILFKIRAGGWDWLDQKEGQGTAYRRKSCTVLTRDGRFYEATTYEVVPGRRERGFVEPAPGYPEIVASGLKHYGFSTAMLEASANNRVAEFEMKALFIYGTLLKGEVAEYRLKPCHETAQNAQVPGRLFHLGRYPGLCSAENGDQWVQGDVVFLDKPSKRLKELDYYEDFPGYGRRNSEYLRCLQMAQIGESDIMVWLYKLLDSPADAVLIESGDWRQP
jgi:gamma-glutamylcyclotransferase (GGCT)/AIG2-like uncharacterized protein YtfP